MSLGKLCIYMGRDRLFKLAKQLVGYLLWRDFLYIKKNGKCKECFTADKKEVMIRGT